MAMTRASTPGILLIPGSAGELFDKISILEIKSDRIADETKQAFVRAELDLLLDVAGTCPAPSGDPSAVRTELKRVNEALWEIEDAIRDCEREQDFGPRFIALARSVYKTNDRRAELKRILNTLYGSAIVEQKSYAPQG
jgi:hypothetical protein